MAENPTVRLGGSQYEVPPLAIKHIRAIMPFASKLAVNSEGGVPGGDTIETLYEAGSAMMKVVKPSIEPREYDEMHITPIEIARAFPVFMRQAGFELAETPKPGEAQAESSSQTNGGTT